MFYFYKHHKRGMELEKGFLNCGECKKKFVGKNIFIFGTGADAEEVTEEMSGCTSILAYIDNYKSGDKNYFLGKRIISLEQYIGWKEEKQPILIATYLYAVEICKQLENEHLILGEDFFVWDDKSMFQYSASLRDYIPFLKNIWKEKRREDTDGKILIPFSNSHSMLHISYAYCSNYFAEKYSAKIYGFYRFGVNAQNASSIVLNVYKAFNMEELIDSKLDNKRREEADNLCDKIWKNLITWEDWNNITVYGIHFGTTIIRDLLRFYIPCFALKTIKMYKFFHKVMYTIVFWYYYFIENDIKVVLLCDGVSWEGYIRDIALSKNIPTYTIGYKFAKMTLNYAERSSYPYFKEMWKQLTPDEQKYGIEWAKKHIDERIHGGIEEVEPAIKKKFVFAEKTKPVRVLDDNDKLKIIICPHIFEEDCYLCGEQIFDNNYFEWLCHLGELSEKTPNYDWYLKMHPLSSKRDFIIIDMILERYPRIKKIPTQISPLQLREEGVKFALTVYGTIGHEYPEIGIQVINAGINPHSAFDFTWNPKTKEEYDDLILNLEHLEEKRDQEGLYQFYSLNYLFYDWDYIPFRRTKLFFTNPFLYMDRIELQTYGKSQGTWQYEEYMKEWTEERHLSIQSKMESIFQKLDEWRPDVLYRKEDGAI